MTVRIKRSHDYNKFIVTEETAQRAVRLGLADDVVTASKAIHRKLQRAANITHPKGNKRYHEWIFRVGRNRKVTYIHIVRCNTCEDQQRITVHNECPSCHGDGCSRCNNEGTIKGAIPCPDCSKSFDKQKLRSYA